MEIPILDFAKCGLGVPEPKSHDIKTLGDDIVEAFATVGFVYLENAGIPSEMVNGVNRTMKEFCGLKPEIKNLFNVALDEVYHGYVGIAGEAINPNRPPDMKEMFNTGGEGFLLPNSRWPEEYVPGFSNAWKELYEMCHQLSLRILDLLTAGLKVKDKDFLRKNHSRLNGLDNYTTMRALYYPPISKKTEVLPNQVRLGEHSDYGCFTLLFQDDKGGLEVEDLEGNYIPAKPIPGTILVNIGDVLQYWTKGWLKATRHRVMIPSGENRLACRQSVAFFVDPDHEAQLTGMEFEAGMQKTNDRDEEYKTPYTAQEYIGMKLKSTHY